MGGKYDELLNDLYFVQMNFDGVDVLYKKAKQINNTISKDDVSKWLKLQSTHQLTKAEKEIGKTELKPIYSEDPFSFQIDLTFYLNINPKIKITIFYLLELILQLGRLTHHMEKIKKLKQ